MWAQAGMGKSKRAWLLDSRSFRDVEVETYTNTATALIVLGRHYGTRGTGSR